LIEFLDGVEDHDARIGGPFRVVVLRLRPAEVGRYAGADIIGDIAAEALDGNQRGSLAALRG
jgi:hypothetical protein